MSELEDNINPDFDLDHYANDQSTFVEAPEEEADQEWKTL